MSRIERRQQRAIISIPAKQVDTPSRSIASRPKQADQGSARVTTSLSTSAPPTEPKPKRKHRRTRPLDDFGSTMSDIRQVLRDTQAGASSVPPSSRVAMPTSTSILGKKKAVQPPQAAMRTATSSSYAPAAGIPVDTSRKVVKVEVVHGETGTSLGNMTSTAPQRPRDRPRDEIIPFPEAPASTSARPASDRIRTVDKKPDIRRIPVGVAAKPSERSVPVINKMPASQTKRQPATKAAQAPDQVRRVTDDAFCARIGAPLGSTNPARVTAELHASASLATQVPRPPSLSIKTSDGAGATSSKPSLEHPGIPAGLNSGTSQLVGCHHATSVSARATTSVPSIETSTLDNAAGQRTEIKICSTSRKIPEMSSTPGLVPPVDVKSGNPHPDASTSLPRLMRSTSSCSDDELYETKTPRSTFGGFFPPIRQSMTTSPPSDCDSEEEWRYLYDESKPEAR